MARTVANFLADLSEENLNEMLATVEQSRARLREEEQALGFEEDLIRRALARKGRRNGGGAASPGGGQVTREQVLDAIRRHAAGERFRALDAIKAARDEGLNLTDAGTRQHLRRLVNSGILGREGDWYVLPAPRGSALAGALAAKTSPNGVHREGEDRDIEPMQGSRLGDG